MTTQAPPASAVHEGILATIGNTPLVRLGRLLPGAPFELFAKLEGGNLGGSIKDRAALSILEAARARGEVGPGTVVVESSSGNMGIGLALACRVYGLRFVCVVDPKTTPMNVALMRAYGAEVDVVAAPDPETGEYLQARLKRVEALRREIPGSFWPNQYANPDNPRAHHRTMQEIVDALDGRLDYLFVATSTCGTLRGCADYAREHGIRTRIVAVDAVGSVIFGGERKKRLIPGHGAAVRPALFHSGLADRSVLVGDLDCVVGCRRLLQREGVLAGGSSGAVVAAVEQLQHEIAPGSRCVAILCDRGERYLDTIFSDAWVRETFGDLEPLWLDSQAELAKALP